MEIPWHLTSPFSSAVLLLGKTRLSICVSYEDNCYHHKQ